MRNEEAKCWRHEYFLQTHLAHSRTKHRRQQAMGWAPAGVAPGLSLWVGGGGVTEKVRRRTKASAAATITGAVSAQGRGKSRGESTTRRNGRPHSGSQIRLPRPPGVLAERPTHWRRVLGPRVASHRRQSSLGPHARSKTVETARLRVVGIRGRGRRVGAAASGVARRRAHGTALRSAVPARSGRSLLGADHRF